MRVLFINRFYPGYFRSLAERFGQISTNTVLFLSEKGSREIRMRGVRRLRVAPSSQPDLEDQVSSEGLTSFQQAAKTANAMLRLRREGFVPDLIYASSDEGYNFYVRDIFPSSFYAVRADWFYTKGLPHTFFHRGKPRPSVDFALPRLRNLFQYNALDDCDLAITGSQWQKAQFPEKFAECVQVVQEGVDTIFFTPASGTRYYTDKLDLRGAQELVTFSSRRAGNYEGFPQFRQSLPRLLTLRPNCHVLIMTSKATSGAYDDRELLTSQDILASLDLPADSLARVHVASFDSLDDYRQLLRASSLHVHLAAPAVLATDLLEAMSCGCLLLASDTPQVREVINHGENGFLTSFWDVDKMAEVMAGVLERGGKFMGLRENARNTVLKNHDLVTQVDRHYQLILDAMDRKKAPSK